MPQALDTFQRELIQNIIDDILDLPSEKKDLQEEITQLKLALDEKPLNANHRYAQLQKCYHHPTAYFQRLEASNPNITVGAVQEHILHCLEEALLKVAPFGTDLSLWGWNLKSYRDKLHFSSPFRSLPSSFDLDHPWQMPASPEKMYGIQLSQARTLRELQVEIRIDLPDSKPMHGETIRYPEGLRFDYEEDEFVREKHDEIRQAAEKKVSEVLLRKLADSGKMEASQADLATEAFQNLLVYKFYFAAILEGKFPIRKLLNVSARHLEILTEPAIMALLREAKCDLESAKNLQQGEFALCKEPYYSQKILQGLMAFQEIQGVSREQSFILNLPSIIYLQKQGKINFSQAKAIPVNALPFFRNQLCLQMLMKDQIPLDVIQPLRRSQASLLAHDYYAGEVFNGRLKVDPINTWTEDQIERLLLPPLIELQAKRGLSLNAAMNASPVTLRLLKDEDYSHLVLKGELAFSFLESLTPTDADLLLHPSIKSLVAQHKLNIDAALRLPPDFVTFLDGHPLLCQIIGQNLVTVDDCLKDFRQEKLANPYCLEWGFIFGSRLIGLLNETPFSNQNGIQDTPATLKNELENVILNDHHCHFLRDAICDQALKIFFRALHRFLLIEVAKPRSAYSPFGYTLSNLCLPNFDLLDSDDFRARREYFTQFHSLVETMQQKALSLKGYRERTLISGGGFLASALAMKTPGGRDLQQLQLFLKRINRASTLAETFKVTETAQLRYLLDDNFLILMVKRIEYAHA